jgi:hypothetical protein
MTETQGSRVRGGWGGPAKGLGWGGPAKGPGTGGPARYPRKPDDPIPLNPVTRRDKRAKRHKEMVDLLYRVASDEKNSTAIRIAAAEKYLDRTAGRPIQPNINHEGQKVTLEQLVIESMAKE